MKFFRLFLPVSITAAMVLTTGCNRQPKAEVKKESGPVAVRTAKVSTRTIQRTVDGVGTLFPYDEAIISAEVEGRLEQVNADLGDLVKEAQVLARIGDEATVSGGAGRSAVRQSLEQLGLKDEGPGEGYSRDAGCGRRRQI